MLNFETELLKLYNGFFIASPVGNNAFSYGQRKHQSIFVPPLIRGSINDMEKGSEIVFSEIEDGIEKNQTGLKNFLWLNNPDKQIFVFDNHNHAFFFWHWGFIAGHLLPGNQLLHIDQHKDTRKPPVNPPFKLNEALTLERVWQYTNFELNVGNFISPAKETGLLSAVIFAETASDFEQPLPEFDILDLDLDIFAPEMDYISFNLKYAFIKMATAKAKFITIATSPYFLDQSKALWLLEKLFL